MLSRTPRRNMASGTAASSTSESSAGTNSIHGTAYAFGRDAAATDSPNYFTERVTPATLEQFGATAGGPILKDKLFWFASYEGLRESVGDINNDTIPADVAMGNANFSMVDACNALNPTHAALGAAGNKINGLSAQISGLNPQTCVVTPSSLHSREPVAVRYEHEHVKELCPSHKHQWAAQ